MLKRQLGGLLLLSAATWFAAAPLFAETATVSDFSADLKSAMAEQQAHSDAPATMAEIKSGEYRSAWDEFGGSILVDGARVPAEITRAITQDISKAIQTEASYDRQELQYLEVNQSTPEEIQNLEESGGSDVPPSEPIDPNPSAAANPEVSVSTTEEPAPNVVGESTSTPEAPPVTSEFATSTEPVEMNIPSENTIFDAILRGEEEVPPAESTPAEPPPAE